MPAIVDSGAAYIAAKTGASQPVQITDFVLAYIAGLDDTQPVDLAETLPDPADIVYQAPVSQSAYLSPDKIVYSLAMDTSVGDFTFNWLGLKASDGTLVAVAYLPDTIKTANSGGVQGNNITRNFLLQFADAQLATGVSVPAETWQVDISAYLNAMDERERLSNLDIYGAGAFFEGGWALVNNAGSYELQPGIGYVGGVRILCTTPIVVAAGALPTAISLDVALQKSGDQVVAEVTPVRGTPADYTDGSGAQHFVVQVADIDSGGVVTDQRQVFDAPNGLAKYLLDLIKSGTAHNHDEQYLGKTAKAADSEKVGGVDSSKIIFGAGSTGTTRITDDEDGWNSIGKSGFYDGNSLPNGPTATSWFWGMNVEAQDGDGHGWQMLATGGQLNPTWYLRGQASGNYGDWHEVITSKGGQTLESGISVKGILSYKGPGSFYIDSTSSSPDGKKHLALRVQNDEGTYHTGAMVYSDSNGSSFGVLAHNSTWMIQATSIGGRIRGNLDVDGDLSVPNGGIEFANDNWLMTRNSSGGLATVAKVGLDNILSLGDEAHPMKLQSSIIPYWYDGSDNRDMLHSGGGQIIETPTLIKGDFDIQGTGPGAQQNGLYVANFGTTSGSTGNPIYTAAICGQIDSTRSIALSVDQSGYLWGYRSHSVAGTYVWHSKVKSADNANTLGGNDSSFYRNASNLNAGQINVTLIPNLSAGKITSGIFGDGRIPDLNASKIISGIFQAERLGAGWDSGAPDQQYLRGDGNWQSLSTLLSAIGGGTGNAIVKAFGISGTYSVPAAVKAIVFIVTGGGGGGGGSGGDTTGSGGGGGAGGTAIGYRLGSAASSYAITIGSGGGGGIWNVNNGRGSTGGLTSVAAGGYSLQGYGGSGGYANPTSGDTGDVYARPGAGGQGTGGVINLTGGDGGYGACVSGNTPPITSFGQGGASFLAGGPVNVTLTPATGARNGADAWGRYGAGGSGSLTITSSSTATGGDGGDGRVIILEFY